MNRYDRGVHWEEESLDVPGTRWVAMYLPVWLYSYQQPGSGMLHYIAVNGRDGETTGSAWLPALGHDGATALYWAIHRYYRNTDKSHAFERETAMDAKPVMGSKNNVGELIGTQEKRIGGNNVKACRHRVS